MSTQSPGLCAFCTHARTIQNDRASVFWLCEASKFNPRLSKYPRLPIFKCEEYQKKEVLSANLQETIKP